VIGSRTKIFLEFLAGLVAGSVILLIAGAWWLWSGPIPLTFLTPYIEDALSPAGSTIAVEIEETQLQWAGWQRAANLRVRDVRVLDHERRVIAEVSEVSLGLSLRALLRAKIAPTYFEIVRPSVSVVRNEDGAFAIGFAKSGEAPDSEPGAENLVLERLIAELMSEPDRSRPLAYLKRVAIIEADLFLDDRQLRQIWHAPRADLAFVRNVIGISASVDADLELDGQQSRVAANAAYETETGIIDATFGFRELDPTPFLRGSIRPVAQRFAELGLKLDGSVAFRMMSDGAVRTVRFDVTGDGAAARGEVSIGDDGYGISAGIEFEGVRWPMVAAAIPEPVERLRADVPIDGKLTLVGTTDGDLMSLDFDLTGGAGTLSLPEIYADPVPVNSLRVRGKATDGFREMRIEEVGISLKQGTVTARAAVTRVGRDLNLRLDGGITDINMAIVRRYWPKKLAIDAREWVLKNIRRGDIDDATMSVVARFPDADPSRTVIGSLNGTLRVRGVEVNYLTRLPTAQGVAANMTFTDKRFDIAFTDGRLNELRLDEGSAIITGLDGDDQKIHIDIVVRGPVESALSILDSEPLRFVAGFGMDAGKISGQTAARIVFNFPLQKDLKIEQVAVATGATLRSVALDKGPFDLSVRDGTLELQLTGAGMTIFGDAALNGVPLKINWEENFSAAAFDRRFTVRGIVDDTARRKLGIGDLPVGTGELAGELTHTIFAGGRSESVAKLDLTKVALDFPALRWRKASEVPGNLNLFMTTAPSGDVVMEDLRVEAGDLRLSARVEVTPDLKDFRTFEFRNLAFAGNSMQGRVNVAADGGFDVELTGERIDLSPFLVNDDDVDAVAVEKGRALRIRASFDEVLLGEGRWLRDVRAVLGSDGTNWRQVGIDAGINESIRLAVKLMPNGNGASLHISTRDAGQALQATNWTDRLKGGSLLVTGKQPAPGDPITGEFKLNQFKVTEAPALARVLQVLSLTGIFSALGQDGLDFVTLDGKFRYYGGALEIKNARAFGSSIGITAEGAVYISEETADLSGTVVPAYTINSVLGNIPILGTILTGGENEGIFAANYVVKGQLEDPRVSVNPLSALAPGFLRNLVGGDVKPLTGEDAQSQSQ